VRVTDDYAAVENDDDWDRRSLMAELFQTVKACDLMRQRSPSGLGVRRISGHAVRYCHQRLVQYAESWPYQRFCDPSHATPTTQLRKFL